VNEFEQNLLLISVALKLTTSLVVVVVQFVRRKRGGDD